MNKNGCLICGAELSYNQSANELQCEFCKNKFVSNVSCENGHYICDSCHSMGALDSIEEFCLNTELTDPIIICQLLMKHPSVKMHGPEHHFLVPASLLAAHANTTVNKNSLKSKLKVARERAQSVPGGFCGTHGNCGAGVGAGIFVSILTEATPLTTKSWSHSNMVTAKCLEQVALNGGPRCCKRDVYLTILTTVKYCNSELNTSINVSDKIQCEFVEINKQCTRQYCLFYNGKT